MVNEIRFGGPVKVAYYQEDGEWWCVALQFDLMGSGNTREEALNELKELIVEYILACVKAANEGKTVVFFHPSSEDRWNIEDSENFQIVARVRVKDSPAEHRMEDFSPKTLRRFSPSDVGQIDLIPA